MSELDYYKRIKDVSHKFREFKSATIKTYISKTADLRDLQNLYIKDNLENLKKRQKIYSFCQKQK